ncbi:MAG: N-acetylmuramic acid 6-phosphate etherase [Gemmatimonadales bacterium]|nr:N-acetylmuramic acid 6-phosphate etherase [Gemmatimonadales bacterium]MBP6571766.1 N-acetylmuramic acid 6-phosphate etherase [Gemmatimonadales bacterium]MBP7620077.1 N-acetylmuramic acid 6-phosphate etherase [Gemmatimonadales bacterium]
MTSPLRSTERRNPRSTDLDLLEPSALVALFVAEEARIPVAIEAAQASIAAAMTLIEAAFRRGGRLTYVGAGTSGRLGVLDASECPPTFGTPPAMVQGIIAGGPDALVRSVEGAEDDPAAGAAAIDARAVGADDVVVGIAASGTTPFVHGALHRAAARGARTVFFSCAEPPAAMVGLVDVVIHVDVGPELVTGSTRLKAGTATKLVLNMLTTGAMVRIGKTWGNLMVDVQVTNAKLEDRGERIVMEATGAPRAAARTAIRAAGGRVRTAIVMLHEGIDAVAAEARLVAVDRRLRAIVGDPPPIAEPA